MSADLALLAAADFLRVSSRSTVAEWDRVHQLAHKIREVVQGEAVNVDDLARYRWIVDTVYDHGCLTLTQLASAGEVGGGFCVENDLVLGVADSLEAAIDDARKPKQPKPIAIDARELENPS